VGKTPEQELREFLAQYPRWLQQALQWNFSTTAEDVSAFAQYGWDRYFELLERYEALACRVPAEWREYRKRRKQIALAGVPTGKPGRPRMDLLAEEAMELKSRGKSYAKIAREMKRRHPHQDARKPDAIRKLIASRKPRLGPEKI
jgi:hypothetical protein